MARRDYGWYAPSKPKEAKCGIKSQSGRGAFGKSWWAQRWIEVLESFDIGARLSRGRAYARKGQVLTIEVENGQIQAKVQGSRRTPYKVSIQVATLNKSEWDILIEALSEQAYFAAKLLAGEMPEDIESVFKAAKLSLFPQKMRDIDTDCSCPDWSNPCKHIAAVYYLLGEEFDRDPFLIFKLRGMEREELLNRLQGSVVETIEEKPIPEPLATQAKDYWTSGILSENFLGDIRTPPISAALPKRLGAFPFWRGEKPLLEDVEQVYSSGTMIGLGIVFGNDE